MFSNIFPKIKFSQKSYRQNNSVQGHCQKQCRVPLHVPRFCDRRCIGGCICNDPNHWLHSDGSCTLDCESYQVPGGPIFTSGQGWDDLARDAPIVPTLPPCVDTNWKTCSIMRRLGRCHRNFQTILHNCRKTCNACNMPVPTTTAIVTTKGL